MSGSDYWAKIGAEIGAYLAGAGTPERVLRQVGAYALDAHTVPEGDRRAVIAGRLPSHDWPARRLQVTAVDAATGELRIFQAGSGASLVDAVAASSAVPGIWPPVTIGASRYVDGGVRSADNADLASCFSRITVISPLGGHQDAGRAGRPGAGPGRTGGQRGGLTKPDHHYGQSGAVFPAHFSCGSWSAAASGWRGEMSTIPASDGRAVAPAQG